LFPGPAREGAPSRPVGGRTFPDPRPSARWRQAQRNLPPLRPGLSPLVTGFLTSDGGAGATLGQAMRPVIASRRCAARGTAVLAVAATLVSTSGRRGGGSTGSRSSTICISSSSGIDHRRRFALWREVLAPLAEIRVHRHLCRGFEPDQLPGLLPHDLRHASPMRRLANVGRPVWAFVRYERNLRLRLLKTRCSLPRESLCRLGTRARRYRPVRP
jgi:hypothetical protein